LLYISNEKIYNFVIINENNKINYKHLEKKLMYHIVCELFWYN